MTKLILASASPRRIDLLKQIGYTPDAIVPAGIDETPLKRENPASYTKRIALDKANKVSQDFPQDLVLACDTTVVVGTRILGKPKNKEEAKVFLKMLSGRQHKVISTVVLMKDGIIKQRTVITAVRFKNLSDVEMDFHTNSMQWEGKSGGYMIQGLASAFTKRINGSVTNVIGLPLYETSNLLNYFGVSAKLHV